MIGIRNDMQMTLRGFPTEREIWESVIAIPKWNKGNLFKIELTL